MPAPAWVTATKIEKTDKKNLEITYRLIVPSQAELYPPKLIDWNEFRIQKGSTLFRIVLEDN